MLSPAGGFILHKKILIFMAFLSLSAVSLPAKADIIRCVFTEPFFNLTYSMGKESMTIKSPHGKRVYHNIGFLILKPGHFVIGDHHRPIVDLKLNYKGSDGMSDFVYPYTAHLRSPHHPHRKLDGGCESLHLKKRSHRAAGDNVETELNSEVGNE